MMHITAHIVLTCKNKLTETGKRGVWKTEIRMIKSAVDIKNG